MIALDTSAVMAILQGESAAPACMTAIEDAEALVMSAGTLTELLVVSDRRGIGDQAERFVRDMGIEIDSVTAVTARQISAAYSKWGKGVHPASLNLGDCFAYALARSRNCALLFVGNDFSQTDISSALG